MREQIVRPDGYPGIKWPEEAVPETVPHSTLDTDAAGALGVPLSAPSILSISGTFDTEAVGMFTVTLTDANGIRTWLRVDAGTARAAFGGTGSPSEARSLAEGARPHTESTCLKAAHNYAVEHLLFPERAFSLRMALLWNAKIGGTVIDCEIGGTRTMLTHRPGFVPCHIAITCEGGKVSRAAIAAFKEAAL